MRFVQIKSGTDGKFFVDFRRTGFIVRILFDGKVVDDGHVVFSRLSQIWSRGWLFVGDNFHKELFVGDNFHIELFVGENFHIELFVVDNFHKVF